MPPKKRSRRGLRSKMETEEEHSAPDATSDGYRYPTRSQKRNREERDATTKEWNDYAKRLEENGGGYDIIPLPPRVVCTTALAQMEEFEFEEDGMPLACELAISKYNKEENTN